MNKITRRLAALGLAATMVGALAACGGNSSDTQTAAGGDNVTIKFTWWGNQTRHDYTQKILDKYTELHPNVKFEAIPAGWDGYFDKLSTQAASGSMPDIVQMDYLYLTTYANNNSIADLQPYVDDGTIDVSQIADNVVDAGKVDKKLAGIVGGTGTVAIGYNPEVFKEAGIEEPNQDGSAWTWDEFVEMAQKLTLDTEGRNAADPDFDANNIKQYGVMFGTDWNVYMPFILSAGGGYLNESMDGLGLNDEKSAQILQNFADLINVYHVSPTAVQKNAMPSAATALAAKQTAMYIDGSWNHLDLMNSGCNWGVGVLPIDENYTTFFDGGSLIIFKSTKHLEASEKLYLWLTNPESSERITELYRTLWMPVQTEYYTDPDKIDFWASEELPARPEGFQDAIVKATYDHAVVATEINVKNFNEINTLVGSALEQVWSGKKTAEEAMTEVKSQTDSLVEGTYSGERS